MAFVFESPILTKKQSVNGQFRPAMADGNFYSDVIIGTLNTYVPPVVDYVYFVDQSGNRFVDESGNFFIAS